MLFPFVLLTFCFFACREDLWWRFSGVRTSEESLSGVASAPQGAKSQGYWADLKPVRATAPKGDDPETLGN